MPFSLNICVGSSKQISKEGLTMVDDVISYKELMSCIEKSYAEAVRTYK